MLHSWNLNIKKDFENILSNVHLWFALISFWTQSPDRSFLGDCLFWGQDKFWALTGFQSICAGSEEEDALINRKRLDTTSLVVVSNPESLTCCSVGGDPDLSLKTDRRFKLQVSSSQGSFCWQRWTSIKSDLSCRFSQLKKLWTDKHPHLGSWKSWEKEKQLWKVQSGWSSSGPSGSLQLSKLMVRRAVQVVAFIFRTKSILINENQQEKTREQEKTRLGN